MKRSDVFPSKYLQAADFETPQDLQIESLDLEMLEAQGEKPKEKGILTFTGLDKRLVLNVTNWDTLENLYGEESDDWSGKWITLYATTCRFGSKTVPCVRIKEEAPRRFDPPPIETATAEVNPLV